MIYARVMIGSSVLLHFSVNVSLISLIFKPHCHIMPRTAHFHPSLSGAKVLLRQHTPKKIAYFIQSRLAKHFPGKIIQLCT